MELIIENMFGLPSIDKVKDIIRGAIKEFEETLTCLSRWQEFTEKERKPRDYIYFTVGEG
jgi:hypothetical protein